MLAQAVAQTVVHPIPLQWFLIVAIALFAIGSAGVLARRNALTVLMSVEIIGLLDWICAEPACRSTRFAPSLTTR